MGAGHVAVTSSSGDLHTYRHRVLVGRPTGPFTTFDFENSGRSSDLSGPFLSADGVSYGTHAEPGTKPATLITHPFDGPERVVTVGDQPRAAAGRRVAWFSSQDRLVVADARDGTVLHRLGLPALPDQLRPYITQRVQLDDTGRVLVIRTTDVEPSPAPLVMTAGPDESVLRRLSFGTEDARLADGNMAYVTADAQAERLVVRDLDDDRIIFTSAATSHIGEISPGVGGIGWRTFTCALAATYGSSAEGVPAGPCRRPEISLRAGFTQRHLSLRTACLSAPAGHCTAKIRLTLPGRSRPTRAFALVSPQKIPVGHRRLARIPVPSTLIRCANLFGAVVDVVVAGHVADIASFSDYDGIIGDTDSPNVEDDCKRAARSSQRRWP